MIGLGSGYCKQCGVEVKKSGHSFRFGNIYTHPFPDCRDDRQRGGFLPRTMDERDIEFKLNSTTPHAGKEG